MRWTLRLLPVALGAVLLATTPAAAAPDLSSSGIVVADGEPPLPVVTASSYVVADLDTGEVLAAKDAHGHYAPASTLKTLTALTLIPRLDPARQVTPTEADVGIDGTKVGLVPTLSYSVHDLFTALLVVSANDAAATLADAAGGQAATAELMDAEARRLHARDTHAVNPSGLDADGQVSSAYDLALIARAAMRLPDFRAYVAVRRAFIPAPGGATIEIDTHNKLLASYPGAIGIKNGFTEAARASFVGAATRNGRTLVVTLLHAEPAVAKEAAALLDWGFASPPRPVGRLVPVDAAPTAAPATAALARATQPRAAPPATPVASTRSTASSHATRDAVVAALLLLAVLVVLRRRAVVRARHRARGAQRRSRSRTDRAV